MYQGGWGVTDLGNFPKFHQSFLGWLILYYLLTFYEGLVKSRRMGGRKRVLKSVAKSRTIIRTMVMLMKLTKPATHSRVAFLPASTFNLPPAGWMLCRFLIFLLLLSNFIIIIIIIALAGWMLCRSLLFLLLFLSIFVIIIIIIAPAGWMLCKCIL